MFGAAGQVERDPAALVDAERGIETGNITRLRKSKMLLKCFAKTAPQLVGLLIFTQN